MIKPKRDYSKYRLIRADKERMRYHNDPEYRARVNADRCRRYREKRDKVLEEKKTAFLEAFEEFLK